jgi:predicted RNase H-like HicB family nuclease
LQRFAIWALCGKVVNVAGMIRTYSLIIEGDGAGYSGYVPELPTILVTGSSIEELTTRAREAIQLYWETLHTDPAPGSTFREIEVELPLQTAI